MLAVHWRNSGHGGRAVRYLVRAAGQARAALAFDRAARLYREAMALLPPDGEERRQLCIKLADALANAGRGGAAGDAYLEAIAGASSEEALELRRRAAEQLLRGGLIDRGMANLEEVLAAVGMPLPSTASRSLLSLALRRARLRLRGLEPTTTPTLAPDERMRLEVCRTVAIGLSMVDNIRGADFQTRSLLLELRAAQPERLAQAIAFEACFISTGGQGGLRRTLRLEDEAVRLAGASHDPRALAWAATSAGVPGFLQGRFRRGLDGCDRAAKIFAEHCDGNAWEVGSVRLIALWCLWFLGDVVELRRRLPLHLREAEARGDVYALTNLRLAYCANAWLAADDPAQARAQASAAMGEWSQRGVHLQHFYDLYTRAQTCFYEGDASAAEQAVALEWSRLRRALILHIEAIRINMLDLRARIALVRAPREPKQRKTLLRRARSDARKLIAIGSPSSVPLGWLLRSRLAELAGDRAAASALAAKAAEGFGRADMALYQVLAERRQGELDESEGNERVAAAEAKLRTLGIAAPSRMAALLTP